MSWMVKGVLDLFWSRPKSELEASFLSARSEGALLGQVCASNDPHRSPRASQSVMTPGLVLTQADRNL